MGQLFIIRGAPGSGKSTFSNKLKSRLIKFGYEPNEVIQKEADMWFIDDNGNYNWSQEQLPSAHKWCFDEVSDALNNNKVVIVSNTFITRKSLKKYIKLAEKLNIDYNIYRCNGNFQNIHNVPEDVVNNMKTTIQPYTGEIFVD